MELNGMKWNWMWWNGIECDEMELNGMKWNWMWWNGIELNEMEMNWMKWNWMGWSGIEWDEMECFRPYFCTKVILWRGLYEWMNEWMVFLATFLDREARLVRVQLVVMRWTLIWIMPLMQDRSLDLLTYSPSRYHCALSNTEPETVWIGLDWLGPDLI